MTQLSSLFALGFFVAVSTSQAAKPISEITFLENGKKLKSVSLKDMKAGNLVPVAKPELIEPQAKTKKTFAALPMKELLEKVYGKNWASAKMLIATCVDGYRPAVQIKKFADGEAYLAFGYSDDSAFTTTKAGKSIEVGPTYMVWPKEMSDDERAKSLAAGDWPYQVKALDLIR